jgi:hypothetical protein
LKLTAFITQIKKKIYQIGGTVQISNRKILERDNIDTSNINLNDFTLPWLGTGTKKKVAGLS